jgi:hypothetical protein
MVEGGAESRHVDSEQAGERETPYLLGSGDHVFASDAGGSPTSSVLWHGWTDGWHAYATGYKIAADLVAAHVETRGRGQDLVVYPAMFLYRQYLELAIKGLTLILRRLADSCDEGTPTTHDIAKLWQRCRAMLSQIAEGDSEDELRHVDRLIGEFCQHDPKSQAFRYPEDKEGRATLADLRWIDLLKVRSVMDKLGGLLDAIHLEVGLRLNAKAEEALRSAEFEAEMRNYFDRDPW